MRDKVLPFSGTHSVSSLSLRLQLSLPQRWKLILCINWTRLSDAQVAGKTLFLVCLWEGLWKRLAFASVGWVRMMRVASEGGHHPVVEGLHRTKRLNLLSAWAETSIFFCPWTSELLLGGPLVSDWDLHGWLPWFWGLWAWTGTTPPAFLGL